MVTGQAPVTPEWRNTPGKTYKQKMVHAYIVLVADAIHASARKLKKMKSGFSLRCARSILVHTSHYSRLTKPTTPLATQKRLSRTRCIFLHVVPITTHTRVRLKSIGKNEEQNRTENKRKEKKREEHKPKKERTGK